MVTNWYVIPNKEALTEVVTDTAEAGDPPYLLVDIGGSVIIFDFHSMLEILNGYNAAVVTLATQTQEHVIEFKEQLADTGN